MPQTYRRIEQLPRLRGFNGKAPTAEEMRTEFEDYARNLNAQYNALIDQLNERDAALVAQIAALTPTP